MALAETEPFEVRRKNEQMVIKLGVSTGISRGYPLGKVCKTMNNITM